MKEMGSLSFTISLGSVSGSVRIGPFACVQNRLASHRGAQLEGCRQTLHPLTPAAECREFRVHGLAFLREAEGECARQQVEIRKRELGPDQVALAVRQFAFQD